MARQLICSSIDFQTYQSFKKKIASSTVSHGDYRDYVAEGYQPDFGWLKDPKAIRNGKVGVLAHYDNEPLACLDRPTLNLMFFSKDWAQQCLIDNPLVKVALELGCYYMSDFHRNSDCVDFPDIAGRITDQRISDDGKLVVGGYDILDTPLGRQVYVMSKIAPIGTSTRGWGELGKPNSDGVREVITSEYTHVCSDFVTMPAVPSAFVDVSGHDQSPTLDDIYQNLTKYITQGLHRDPKNPGLLAIQKCMNKKDSSMRDEYQDVLSHMKRRRIQKALERK